MNGILKSLLDPLLNTIGQWINEKIIRTPGRQLHKKVLRLFEAHGIEKTEIPLFLPEKFGITIGDTEDSKAFQHKITGDLLKWLSDTFNINPKWFHDDKAHIYSELPAYKFRIKNYVDLLERIKKQKKTRKKIVSNPLTMLKTVINQS